MTRGTKVYLRRLGPTLAASSLIAVTACLPASAANVIERVGAEFAANTTTTNRQLEPTVARLSNGNFAVAWTDESHLPPDTSGSSGIRARIFSRMGTAPAKDFPVNRGIDLTQYQPAATGLSGGGFVVIWSDNGFNGAADEDGLSVRGQRFDNAGGKQGGQFTVNRVSQGDQYRPSITATRNGGFAASWDDWSNTNGDDSVSAVRGQSFSANGGRLGQEFRANTTTFAAQGFSSVAGLSTGNLVVAWTDISQTGADDDSTAVRTQILTPQGAKVGAERVVNTTKAWNQEYPSVAGLLDGRYVAVWEDYSETGKDTSERALRGQIMSSAGAKVGPEFLVNTKTGNNQREPAVAAFPNGRFVVVWTDYSASPDDPSGTAVRAQVFTAAGAKLGSEIRVNQRWAGDQYQPAVATLNNRDFVVVWTDGSGVAPDKHAPGIRGQVFHLTQ